MGVCNNKRKKKLHAKDESILININSKYNISDNKRRKILHVNPESSLMNINSKYIMQKIFYNLIKIN